MSGLGYTAPSGDPASSLFAFAKFGGQVRLFEAAPLRLVSSFPTVFPGVLGSIALATSSGAPMIVTTPLGSGRLVAYDGYSGSELWEHSNSRPFVRVAPVHRLGGFAISPDRGPMEVVRVDDGSAISQLRGVRGLLAGATRDLAVATRDASASLVTLRPWKSIRRLSIHGWAVLAAAFSSSSILVSDVADGENAAVYSFDDAGTIEWRIELAPHHNAPWLGFDLEIGDWVGVVQDVERRSPYRLVRWSVGGAEKASFPVAVAQDYAFVDSGRLLVHPGAVIDTRTGAIMHRLDAT